MDSIESFRVCHRGRVRLKKVVAEDGSVDANSLSVVYGGWIVVEKETASHVSNGDALAQYIENEKGWTDEEDEEDQADEDTGGNPDETENAEELPGW